MLTHWNFLFPTQSTEVIFSEGKVSIPNKIRGLRQTLGVNHLLISISVEVWKGDLDHQDDEMENSPFVQHFSQTVDPGEPEKFIQSIVPFDFLYYSKL